MTKPLAFSVRADLFRVAQAFCDVRIDAYASVWIEPVGQPGASDGGVVMVGHDGADLIAVHDETGQASRGAFVTIGNHMVKTAIDLFRRDGAEQRLICKEDVAWLYPGPSTQAARDIERPAPNFDWRAALQRHAIVRLEPPFVFDARMAKRLSDAAIGLARASGAEDESFELKGGVLGATLATFLRYHHEQGLSKRLRTPDELFAPETLEAFKI